MDRYDICCLEVARNDRHCFMPTAPDGAWVRYDDYSKQAELHAIRIGIKNDEIDNLDDKLSEWIDSYNIAAADVYELENSGLSIDWKADKQDLKDEIASLQAKIDELMLEYCPEDMTEEQLEAWGKAQVPVEIKDKQS